MRKRVNLAGCALLAGLLLVLPNPSTPAQDAERVSRLQGTASLGRNRPVVGATVLVHAQESRERLYLTSTDETGTFRVDDLRDGPYRVSAEREGLAPVHKDEISVKFPFRAVVELAMSATEMVRSPAAPRSSDPGGGPGSVELSGTIVERGAGPVGEFRVRVVRPDGAEDPRISRSLPDGSFGFEGLSAGPWRVEIGGVGFLAQRILLDLREDTELVVIAVRQPADYRPTPLELMPTERPIPPEGFGDDGAQVPTPALRTAK